MHRNISRSASSAALLLGAVLVTTACAATTPATAGDTTPSSAGTLPSQTVTTDTDPALAELLPDDFGDTLVVGLNLTSPPGRFKDADGEPTGFNVEIGRLIAQKLGLASSFQDVPFDTIIPGLAADRFDLTISSMSRTPEREEQIDMVEYMLGGAGVLVPAGNELGVDVDDPTTLCGAHVGAMAGSYQEVTMVPQFDEGCAEAGLPPIDYTSSANNNDAVLALSSGRLDAVLADSSVTGYAESQNGGAFESLTFSGTVTETNIGLSKDSPLTPVVVSALQAVMDDGSYGQVLAKWGVDGLALDTASAEASR